MAGATAGSATTHLNQLSDNLQVLTLTINNQCNMSCPHCYLQYDGDSGRISEELITSVISSKYSHLAIIGKEPLLDMESARVTERLIHDCVRSGKTVSITTNGSGLSRLDSKTLGLVRWIDISLDGGPGTYQQYRGANYWKLIELAKHSLNKGLRELNALHTLTSENLHNLDDMVAIAEDVPWNQIIFSPYVMVRNHGKTPVSRVGLDELLSALANSKNFLNCRNTTLMLGADFFKDQGIESEWLVDKIRDAGIFHKVSMISHDPLRLGYMRLTYDGYIMTPYQSLHPADYHLSASSVKSFANLQEAFATLSPVCS